MSKKEIEKGDRVIVNPDYYNEDHRNEVGTFIGRSPINSEELGRVVMDNDSLNTQYSSGKFKLIYLNQISAVRPAGKWQSGAISRWAILIIALLLAIALVFTGCSSDKDFDKGKRQLEAMGYGQVKNTGYTSFCCSDSDDFSTGFSAVDRFGNKVEGCFCSSLDKGLTIRFE